MTFPAYPLWFLLTWACILWYGFLVFYVGYKSLPEIRRMIANLRAAAKGR